MNEISFIINNQHYTLDQNIDTNYTIYDFCKNNEIKLLGLDEKINKPFIFINGLLKDATSTYLENNAIIDTISKELYFALEEHPNLNTLLKNKNIHKLAIIDKKMSPKTAQILNKGFNEVITKDFIRKFKIIEESALILKEIARLLDGLTFKKPMVILEDDSLINLVPNELLKNIVNVGSFEYITKQIFKATLDEKLIEFVYITEDKYNNKTNKEVTFSYLETLEDVACSSIDNVHRLLKVVDEEVNYNSFVNYLIDILKTKQTLTKDIYQTDEFVLTLGNKQIKIVNLLKGNVLDADIILVLKDESMNITKSVLKDVDVNYIYQNYLKEPGKI